MEVPEMPLEEAQDTVPVALYIRTLAGDPGNSLQAQLTALQRYARRRQLDAVRVFFDIQGGRSQFEAMLAEATGENPPFRQVLVHDEGRLCRCEDEMDELRASNCVGCQEGWAISAGRELRHEELFLTMAFRIVSSLRMQATKATFFVLPASSSLW